MNVLLLSAPLCVGQLLDVLAPRFTKEADTEAISGEDRSAAPSPTSKRRRRRKRSSTNTPVPNSGVSDSEYLTNFYEYPHSSTDATTAHPASYTITSNSSAASRHIARCQARSTTPNHFPSTSASPEQMQSSPLLTLEEEPRTEQDRPEPARRRSVVVEEEEDERSPMLFQYPGLPQAHPNGHQSTGLLHEFHIVPTRHRLYQRNPLTQGLSVYLSTSVPGRRRSGDTFPSSPYPTPSQDRVRSEDDEEEVLYPADTYHLRPYDDGYGREISWIASPGQCGSFSNIAVLISPSSRNPHAN